MRKRIFEVAEKLREDNYSRLNEIADLFDRVAEESSEVVARILYESLR